MTASCRSKNIAETTASTVFALCIACLAAVMPAFAQAQQPAPQAPPQPDAAQPAVIRPAAVAVPRDYRIGTDDVLGIVYWRDKEMSAEVVVRPDGRISLPILNDVEAAGNTPDQLRVRLEQAASKFINGDPNVSVVVKAINSRKIGGEY